MGRRKNPRIVSGRESFIDHIQRVEAYIAGASLSEVEKDELPEHLKNSKAAAYAGMLYDTMSNTPSAPKQPSPGSENDG